MRAASAGAPLEWRRFGLGIAILLVPARVAGFYKAFALGTYCFFSHSCLSLARAPKRPSVAWVDVIHLRRMVIDAGRRVAIPDWELTDGKILNVKEHGFSASGAHIHAVFIIESLARQVKESA